MWTQELTWLSQLLRSSQNATFSAECSLLLALLANYHRSDASALNAFLRGIKDTRDTAALAQICSSIQIICASAVKCVPTSHLCHFALRVI